MTKLVERLRRTLTDKDNMPRHPGEKWLAVGLAKEAADEIERLEEALHELHLLIDFDEPITDEKPMVFSDATAINAAMQQARAALNIHKRGEP